MLDAIALEEIPLAVRVCWRDGVLWYDLGREAVRIDGRGWTIESNPPVLFKRFPDSLRQVQPARGGDFSLIDKYLPIDPMSDLSFLLKIWLLAGLSPNGPRPILDLAGGGGVGKSTTQKFECRFCTGQIPRPKRVTPEFLGQSWWTPATEPNPSGCHAWR